MGKRSIVISLSVCLSVCLSVHLSVCVYSLSVSISLEPQNFVCRSPVAMAPSSSGGVAICYVIPVLSITSCLAVVHQVGRPTSTSGVEIPG